jgi:hypothetical protein
MLNDLRQKLANLLSDRTTRGSASRKCPPVERLEDRAMLSASIGAMPYEYGLGGPVIMERATSAPPSTHVISYEYESMDGSLEIDRLMGDAQFQPAMDLNAPFVSPRMDALGLDPHGARYDSGREFTAAGPPLQMVTYVFYVDVGHPTTANQTGSSSSPLIEKATAPPSYANPSLDLNLGAPDYDDIALPPKGPAPPSNPVAGVTLGGKGPGNSVTGLPSSKSNPIEYLTTEHEYPPSVLAIESALTDLTTATTNSARETNSTSTISSMAHDIVLQDYMPRTPLTTVSTPYDQAKLGPIGIDTTSDVDGFIQTPSDSTSDDVLGTSDAVARERDAVNEILRDLQDVGVRDRTDWTDSGSSVARSSAQGIDNEPLDLPIDIAGNELPVGEVDGGMVLLQSNGDTYDSEIDLTTMYADQLEKVVAPVGMETSVGIYEAMDVAAEEVPVANYGTSIEATAGVPREIPVSEKLPVHAKQSSHKAAAIIGATTLTGALVWMNRNRTRDREDAAAEDERRHRD